MDWNSEARFYDLFASAIINMYKEMSQREGERIYRGNTFWRYTAHLKYRGRRKNIIEKFRLDFVDYIDINIANNDIRERLVFLRNYNKHEIGCGKSSVVEVKPSKDDIGKIVKVTRDGREIKVKAGKLYKELMEYVGREVSAEEVEKFANDYTVWHSQELAVQELFISDYGDVSRLIYAYRNWECIRSCMAQGGAEANEDLRDDGENYHSMLKDYFVNRSEWRVAIIHKGGKVLARCILRNVYYEKNTDNTEEVEEYAGVYIERMYLRDNRFFDEYLQIIKDELKERGEKIAGWRYQTSYASEIKYTMECENRCFVPYIKWMPFSYDNAAAYQDTFRFFDQNKNRCLTNAFGIVSEIVYNAPYNSFVRERRAV